MASLGNSIKMLPIERKRRSHRLYWRDVMLVIGLPLVALALTSLLGFGPPYLRLVFFYFSGVLVAYYAGITATIASSLWSLFLVELILIRPQLAFRPLEAQTVIFYLSFVGVVSLIAYLQDTVKRTNIALEATAEHFQTILNAVEDGITVQNRDGQYIYTNDAASVMTGLKQKEIVNISREEVRASYKMFDVDGNPLTLEDMPTHKARTQGVRSQMIFRSNSIYVPDDRWIDLKAVPVMDDNGSVQFVVNVFRDVTEAQESEQQRKALQDKIVEQALTLDKERKRLENILNTVPMMVWEGEGDPATGQSMIFVNRYGVELLGYALEEWQSAPDVGMEWVHPDDVEFVKKKTEENFHAATPIPFDFRFITKDGRVVTVEARPTIVLNDEGVPIAARGVMVDISERRRVEDELRRSNEELAQFAYIASHDLQEPLRMVTSYLQLLQDRYQSGLNEEANEFIGFAVDGANRMKALINDLLTHSRLQTNREKFTRVDMNEVAKRVLANLDARIRETDAKITIEPLPTVLGSATMLTQLLQNLLSNGLKFHGDAPPHIRISVEKRRSEWLFAVRDNGIGIDPKYADRIFMIFQRLHSRAKYSGTGIGLAICKKVVERHQGRIWVESQKGAGATFYFTIPFSMS